VSDSEPQAYHAYWSIYTDLPSRVAFRKLYWEKLKDIVGRPAKLVRIDREMDWPPVRPMRELRCHVYSHFAARTPAEAVTDTLARASKLAFRWQVLDVSEALHDKTVAEFVWNRSVAREPAGPADSADGGGPLPLVSVMVSLLADQGDRLRPGMTMCGGGERERPSERRVVSPDPSRRDYTASWSAEVQTSTKRSLMETHWPALETRFAPHPIEMVELETRQGDVGSFRFKVRQTLADTTEAEAIAACLHLAAGMKVSLTATTDSRLEALSGQLYGPHGGAVRIGDFKLRQGS
jgi:hypothetical protein